MIRLPLLAGMLLAGAIAYAAPSTKMRGVSDVDRTRNDWIMNCQGCHKADASSRTGGVPSLAGNVSRFLHVPDGRAFLGRVPGVAFAPLPDRRVADLLNWTVQTYDPAHVPADFAPYTAAEVRALRKQPLITQSMIVRRALMEKIEEAQ